MIFQTSCAPRRAFVLILQLLYEERRWGLKQLIGSCGMLSSHSATVIALAAAIGFQEGFGESVFAVSLVMYDASGVRLHAGRQAEVLNQIACELPAEHPLAESRPQRELLGHTPSSSQKLIISTVAIGRLIVVVSSQASCYSKVDCQQIPKW
ncbi:hypothetical protein UlMin_001181 [Ulmus minor]